MTADDLSAPLGRQKTTSLRRFPTALPFAAAGVLALFLGIFVLWAVLSDEPFGGEPTVAVPIASQPAMAAKKAMAPGAVADARAQTPSRYDGPAVAQQQPAAPAKPALPPNTKTVTIIDGKTGARQEVMIPMADGAGASGAPPAEAAPPDQKFVEMTSHGPLPKIATDGTRPAEAFARPVKPIPGKPDAPRIALIIGGLGVSASATADAIAKLPSQVTLAFIPYGPDVGRSAARARTAGHEILLQVPMEPFDYPNNDPGPDTLLTSLNAEQNVERLYRVLSRFQGYVGLSDTMGARFTASEEAFAPVLRETAKRGLIYVDDGANPRSVAGRIAGANNLPFAKADVIVDSVPTPAEIDHALGRLEMLARERGVTVGIASALPVSIEHIARWAKAAESRGFLLVPITAVALKAKQS